MDISFERKKIFASLLFFLSLPCLVYITSEIILEYYSNAGVYRRIENYFNIDIPNNLVSFILLSPLPIFILSLPFCFVRKSLYKAWLIWTVVWAALLAYGILEQSPHSDNLINPNPFFLAIPYITGSLILLLLEFILSCIKNNQERYEARVMKTLKYLALILVLGTILYNLASYFELDKKIKYRWSVDSSLENGGISKRNRETGISTVNSAKPTL